VCVRTLAIPRAHTAPPAGGSASAQHRRRRGRRASRVVAGAPVRPRRPAAARPCTAARVPVPTAAVRSPPPNLPAAAARCWVAAAAMMMRLADDRCERTAPRRLGHRRCTQQGRRRLLFWRSVRSAAKPGGRAALGGTRGSVLGPSRRCWCGQSPLAGSCANSVLTCCWSRDLPPVISVELKKIDRSRQLPPFEPK
jgi:hypothetical protein